MLSIVVSIMYSWGFYLKPVKLILNDIPSPGLKLPSTCRKYNPKKSEKPLLKESLSFDPRNKTRFVFQITPLRRVVLWILKMFFKSVMDLRVEGLENFPLDGPVVLAANHASNFDVLVMQFGLPRPIFFMVRASFFQVPLLKHVYRELGAFPVHHSEKDEWAYLHAAKVLAHAQTLGMFPEGRRSKGKGLGVAKTGTARLALDANCPIVPMAVIGTDKLFKRLPFRTVVTIRFLPPILPKPGESALALMDRTMFTLAEGLPHEMRGVYAARPRGFGR
jgi:1-acyl-sn-glycerol-3-phosphate acyltransferase